MKRLTPIVTVLASAVTLALAFGALAQTAPDEAKQKELAAAREELHRAASRVSALSRELHGNDRGDMIIERRLTQRPVLGVILEGDAGAGVRIAAVTPESGAAKAGLRSGDRITTIDGKALAGSDGDARLADARKRLRDLDAKTPVVLGYARDGRNATVKVTPSVGDHVLMVHDGDNAMEFIGAPHVRIGPNGESEIEARMVRVSPSGDARIEAREVRVAPGGVMPQIHREIIRRGCDEGDDCRMPLLAEAFRWNGLNLASVDKQLGRYFGTDRGVLVLSIPEGMGGLQPGDVLQKVDGKPVNTPREAMAAAHARKPGSAVPVEYLRDRKLQSTQLTLPERPLLLPPPAPPAPPAPPEPPTPHAKAHPASMAVPPTPPAPPAAPAPIAPPPPPPEPLTLL